MNDTCRICFYEFTEENPGLSVCVNNHRFHSECIKNWIRVTYDEEGTIADCPLGREPLNPELINEVLGFDYSIISIAENAIFSLTRELQLGQFNQIIQKINENIYPLVIFDLLNLSTIHYDIFIMFQYSKFVLYWIVDNPDLQQMTVNDLDVLSRLRINLKNIIENKIEYITRRLSQNEKEQYKRRFIYRYIDVNNRIRELANEYQRTTGHPHMVQPYNDIPDEVQQPSYTITYRGRLISKEIHLSYIYYYTINNDIEGLNAYLRDIIQTPLPSLQESVENAYRSSQRLRTEERTFEHIFIGLYIVIIVIFIILYIYRKTKALFSHK